ncbi:MAG: hypothetical protein Kow00114_09320 [Kiloniellaceae bacterium]
MNLESFRASLSDSQPPGGLTPLQRALWHAARGEWDAAHRLAQDDGSAEGAWVHAHLHRIEGDEGNAGYWYRRAGRPHSRADLQTEREEIARALLQPAPL